MNIEKLFRLLTEIRQDEIFDIESEMVAVFFDAINTEDSNELFSAFCILQVVGGDYFVKSFLKEGIQLGKITKDLIHELREIEVSVSDNNRADPMFKLGRLRGLGVLTQEEVETICNKSLEDKKNLICDSDINFLFHKGTYYRKETTGLTKEFLESCFDRSKHLDAVTQALIAITLLGAYDDVTIEPLEIRSRLDDCIRKNPRSQGIHRFIYLHYLVSKNDEDEENALITMMVNNIISYASDLYKMKSILYQFDYVVEEKSKNKIRAELKKQLHTLAVTLYDYSEDVSEVMPFNTLS